MQGLWWLPAAGEALPPAAGAAPGGGAAAAQDEGLLRLAAAARMNTDVRRACFCAVMGAEDASDAFERMLRLGLKARALPTFHSVVYAYWEGGSGERGKVVLACTSSARTSATHL